VDAKVSVRVNAAELRRQLNRRGLTAAELAAASHVSPATVSHAMNDRSISPGSLRKISETLKGIPECGGGLLTE
jgi:transcriptional regulator with XRE-family HTH domain